MIAADVGGSRHCSGATCQTASYRLFLASSWFYYTPESPHCPHVEIDRCYTLWRLARWALCGAYFPSEYLPAPALRARRGPRWPTGQHRHTIPSPPFHLYVDPQELVALRRAQTFALVRWAACGLPTWPVAKSAGCPMYPRSCGDILLLDQRVVTPVRVSWNSEGKNRDVHQLLLPSQAFRGARQGRAAEGRAGQAHERGSSRRRAKASATDQGVSRYHTAFSAHAAQNYLSKMMNSGSPGDPVVAWLRRLAHQPG